jgi:hypothetical protein
MPQPAACSGTRLSGRHARLGVGLEHEQPVLARLLVPAEIGAAGAVATEHLVRLDRIGLAQSGDLGREFCGEDVLGAPGGVLVLVVVEAVGDD